MQAAPILKEIPSLNTIKLQKIKLKFDIGTLDSIIAFIYKDTVLRTRKTLNNIWKLFNNIDYSTYKDPALLSRVWVIRKSLEARILKGFEGNSMCKQYCKDHEESDEFTDAIVDNIDKLKLSYDECKFLIKTIDDRLEFGYVIPLKEKWQNTIDRIDANEFKTYKQVKDQLYQMATSVININRNTNSLDADTTFSLKDEEFENSISYSMSKLNDKNRLFVTGIKYLNRILGSGYVGKRLYTFLALPGGGKSQMLLKAAIDIKKYNNVEARDPDKIPTVLLITMENDIDETVERIFNMTVSSDDIRNYTVKQVIKKLREEGELRITDKSPIDIVIKYYPNRSIDTNDLYGICKDLYDSGSEVIALILDYLKRIRPAEKAATEKEELKNVTNELKTLATKLEIPVITAHQLNRNSASVIDAAIQNKKEDVARLVGRDGTGSAWEVVENTDVLIIINQEVKLDTGELFLTFKLLKRRYRSRDEDEKVRRMTYFNHPYEPGNEIKLIDDLLLPKSLSVYSLASKFVGLEDIKKVKSANVVKREILDEEVNFDYNPFDVNVANN